MYSNTLQRAIKIGQEGLQQFHKQNYPQAKDKCVQSCRILQQLLNQKEHDDTNLVKGYLIQFLTIAEAASEKIGKMGLSKGSSGDSDLFVQEIQSNMLVTADTSFEDIVGLESIKESIKEAIIYPRMRPDLYKGIRAPPRGILFYGPPGNGKTLMAKAVAHQCKSTFFNVTAASLLSKWVGDSERMLKTIFLEAYNRQPSIIFFDEIDAILSSRSQSQHDASRRLKTEFLVQLDGVSTTDKDNVLVIGATNLPNELDKAALRRFTKKVLIDLPDLKARKHMITKQISRVKSNVSEREVEEIAQRLVLYSAADIKNLIKQAAMMPIRDHTFQELLTIRGDQIRAVDKNDFLKASTLCSPTLNKQQYQKYKRFGDDDNNRPKTTTVTHRVIPVIQTIKPSTQQNPNPLSRTTNVFPRQQNTTKTLKDRIIEESEKRGVEGDLNQQQMRKALKQENKVKALFKSFWNKL